MNAEFLINRLAAGAPAVAALVADLSADSAVWRRDPEKWSALEILCHLRDEEREDFRVRIDLTLHQPATA
jgi:hypothetical protein